MKLIKENRRSLSGVFFLLLLCVACQHISERQMMAGRWHYIKVLNNDTVVFAIADTDHLLLNGDSSFHYEIASVNKVCNGTWKYEDHKLILKYDKPDTVRYFDVELISKRDLIFDEGNRKFVLKRFE